MKEIKINVPEGYEIDKANSTFECIKFKKKSALDYRKVLAKLAEGQKFYFYANEYGCMRPSNAWGIIDAVFTIFDERQATQLFALNKLMNVAAYLNEKPLDWNDDSQGKYYIYYSHYTRTLHYGCSRIYGILTVHFDSYEHAKQAVEILGEDVVKLALGVFD